MKPKGKWHTWKQLLEAVDDSGYVAEFWSQITSYKFSLCYLQIMRSYQDYLKIFFQLFLFS